MPLSPTGSTPNLSGGNASISSLPQHWNSTSNLPVGHSTPAKPLDAFGNPPVAPPSGHGYRDYFSSSAGYTKVSTSSTHPGYTDNRSNVSGGGSRYPPGFVVAQSPEELANLMASGQYRPPSPHNSNKNHSHPVSAHVSTVWLHNFCLIWLATILCISHVSSFYYTRLYICCFERPISFC